MEYFHAGVSNLRYTRCYRHIAAEGGAHRPVCSLCTLQYGHECDLSLTALFPSLLGKRQQLRQNSIQLSAKQSW